MSAAILGLEVIFDRRCDRINLCCARSRFGRIAAGDGQHVVNLVCANCGAARGGLDHNTTAALSNIVDKFGRPTEPVILRAGGRS